jgi:hypothetical protein
MRSPFIPKIINYGAMALKKLGSAVKKQRSYNGLSWVVCEISVPLNYGVANESKYLSI